MTLQDKISKRFTKEQLARFAAYIHEGVPDELVIASMEYKVAQSVELELLKLPEPKGSLPKRRWEVNVAEAQKETLKRLGRLREVAKEVSARHGTSFPPIDYCKGSVAQFLEDRDGDLFKSGEGFNYDCFGLSKEVSHG